MDTEDVAAAADPATDDNGEAEVAHGEAELKEAEDAAEEEEELDPIAARVPRRRGGCGCLLRCCFILVMPALAVLANLFLHRPNPQHFASFRSSAVRRAEFAASWAVCDVLQSTPACGTILAPIVPEVWAQWEARATATVETTLQARLPSSVALVIKATRRTFAGLSAAHELARSVQQSSCEPLSRTCADWVCPLSARGACLLWEPSCARLHAWCAAEASGSTAGSRRADHEGALDLRSGGIGPPTDWISPPLDWRPAAHAGAPHGAETAAPRVRGAHPWLDERWVAAAAHACVVAGEPALAPRSQLPLEALNDGHCDCADGSDEPGTAACAGRGGRFWCVASAGSGGGSDGGAGDGSGGGSSGSGSRSSATVALFAGEWIDTGLVDDGTCDCCDCADEQRVALSPHAGGGTSAAARAPPLPASCTPGQRSHLSPPEPNVLSPWLLEHRAAWAAASSLVRGSRLEALLLARKMAADAFGMGQFLQQQGRPRSQQEFMQLRQLQSQHTMLTNALAHGFSSPLLALALGTARAFEHALLPLFGQCLNATLCVGGCSSHSKAYLWEICPFRHATQSPVGDDGKPSTQPSQPTLIGLFAGWEATTLPSLVSPGAELSAPRPLWRFDNGEACWDGPARSARVELRCSLITALAAVEEDGKCTYWFLLLTPFACAVPYEAEERRTLEAELERREAEAREAAEREAAEREAAQYQAQQQAQQQAATRAEAKRKAHAPEVRGVDVDGFHPMRARGPSAAAASPPAASPSPSPSPQLPAEGATEEAAMQRVHALGLVDADGKPLDRASLLAEAGVVSAKIEELKLRMLAGTLSPDDLDELRTLDATRRKLAEVAGVYTGGFVPDSARNTGGFVPDSAKKNKKGKGRKKRR